MEQLGRVSGYELRYLTAGAGWVDALPTANWLLLVVADAYDRNLFQEVTKQCVSKLPGSICCAGRRAATLEDWFDLEIVVQELDREEKHQSSANFDQAPVTTADSAIEKALWYAVNLAPNTSPVPIHTIVCLDLAGTYRERIVALLPRLRAGWFPPDADD